MEVNRFFRYIKTVVCFVLLLCVLVGCGEDISTKKKTNQIERMIVVQTDNETSDDNNTSEANGDFDYTESVSSGNKTSDSQLSCEYPEKIEVIKADTVTAEFSSASYPWDGPKGYTVVYPKGNRDNRISAYKLQEYFRRFGAELRVTDDTATEISKEILVGNTNRLKSNLAQNEYRVALADSKLVFEGGHSAMTEEAIKWFTSFEYFSGKINLISGKCADFSATVKDSYEYVWGDEFGGNSLDMSKWSFQNRMGGTNKMPTLSDTSVADVDEGLLKLSAIRYYNASRPLAEYATNMTVSSEKSMSYKYGYLEMRAMVPYYRGAWPSFWAVSDMAIGNEKSEADYFIEVDIFEVFSSFNIATPNIHKWYKNGEHTQYNTMKMADCYIFSDSDNLRYEYHIYGFEWTPDKMTMSVDGVDYCTFDLNENYDMKSDMSGFHDNLFILLNNHIYVSDLSLTDYSNIVNNKDLPFEYYVDYIRLYQKSGEGNLNYAE